MCLQICSIASGSNGNCYYIGNSNEAVLIDAGISCREVEKRMKRQGLEMSKVKALFISHEHSDHINGMKTLSKKHQMPVFITTHTLRSSFKRIEKHLINSFNEAEPVLIGGLKITAFKKLHDASDPHSFIVSCDGVNVGVFTDIGFACKPMISYFKQCHAAFLESNYCEDMLMNGPYPVYLKKRISSDDGHLSNKQALELFMQYKGSQLAYLVLSHISKNNNSPELVNNLFTEKAGNTKIIVASRYEETSVYQVEPASESINLKFFKPYKKPEQLSLFGETMQLSS